MRGQDQPQLAGRTGWELRIAGVQRTVEIQGALVRQQGDVVRDAAVAGLDIAPLPRFIVAPALGHGQLVTMPEPFAQDPLPLNVVYPPHWQRQVLATCWALVRFLEKRLRTRLPQ